MVFTSSSYNYINLLQSTYFRTVVQLTGYPEAYSNVVLVTCNQVSSAGSVNANTFQCINSAATFSLSGNTGSIIAWEYSSNNWISTNTITTSNVATATLASLISTIQVRAKIQNGVCPVVNSNTITVVPAQNTAGGLLSGTSSVCAVSNSPSFGLVFYTGTILQWENASAAGGPFNAISPTSGNASLTLSNVTQSQWYRVLVKNGTCPSAYSSTLNLHVDDPSIGGSIVGTQQVCAGINNGTVQLVANTGQIIQWEYSTNQGASWSISSNTAASQAFANIATARLFRTQVQNGICPSVYSSQFTVNVNAAPTPSFNVNNVCMQSMVSFSNATQGNNSYSWAFGDGGSSGIQNPTYAFLSSGTYTVKLTATNTQNCVDSVKKTVLIYPKPAAAFFSNDTLCYGSSLVFNNASSISSGNITQSTIKFGDGNSSSSSPVNHFYNSAGSYSVYVVATSNYGCKDSIGKGILVYPKPYASFTASSACLGTPIIFNNLSTVSNGGLSQLWSFGNSVGSAVQSPSYVYPSPGAYTISLISISSHNCTDTVFRSINVYERPTLSYSATTACFGDPIDYTATAIPAQPSHSFSVGFGDGNSSSNPVSSHLYTSPGTFISNVTVTTDSGCVSSVTKNIVVNAKPFANFNVNNACSSDTIRFNNTSSISSGSIEYMWNLSGISSSTINSPAFLYPAPGNFTISLIATSNFGCKDTIVKTLSVFDSPNGDFVFSNSCDGFPVTFTNATSVGSGIVSSNSWDFGDNTTANVLNPTKEYLNFGNYIVKLIVVSSNGCSDTVRKTVSVFEGPIADFLAPSQCLNTEIKFTNKSTLKSGSFLSEWNFSDSTFSAQDSPGHYYVFPGTKEVSLKVTSDKGCKDSITRYVNAFANPKVSAGPDVELEKGFGVQLNGSGALSYTWSSSSGLSNSFIANPIANPELTTIYIVEGTDKNGCVNNDTVSVTVNDGFIVIPYNVLTPDDNGLNDKWIVKNIESYPDNSLIILDQWNQKVFETRGYKNEWAGANQKGDILPDATYYYILRFPESGKKYTGYITLMRNKK